MRSLSSPSGHWRKLDAPRIAATALVVFGHVVLVLLLQAAMRLPDAARDANDPRESAVLLEFLPNPPPPPTVERTPAERIPKQRPRARGTTPPANKPSTSVVFVDAAPGIADPDPELAPHPVTRDVFDPPPAFKGFPQAPRFESNLPPRAVIRLPDRPSMLQAYWAVPEGENLKGRVARKVPLLGLLLAATGAIGQPDCPPKSEHPDCLRRLLGDADP